MTCTNFTTVAQRFGTRGVVTSGTTQMNLHISSPAALGSQATYYAFGHSGQGCVVTGELGAGQCSQAWMDCALGSTGKVRLNLGGSGGTSHIRFRSGIRPWDIEGYVNNCPDGTSGAHVNLYTFDSAGDVGAVHLGGITIDTSTCPYLDENYGIRLSKAKGLSVGGPLTAKSGGTPLYSGELSFDVTGENTMVFKYKRSEGVIVSATLPLA